jgi:hypothetical protein
MAATSLLSNIYLWIGLTLTFGLMSGGLTIFIIFLAKKTHAMVEFKSIFSGKPIALFFREDRYCEWRPVKPDAGIIQDKDYGAFIVNPKATYIDKKTKSVLLPFDAGISAGINVHASKLADDLQYAVQDEEMMKELRKAIADDKIDESSSVYGLRTTVEFSAIRNMLNALIPHNINAKIEKVIAARLKQHGQINVPQIALLFAAIFGAILLGALVIKLTFK